MTQRQLHHKSPPQDRWQFTKPGTRSTLYNVNRLRSALSSWPSSGSQPLSGSSTGLFFFPSRKLGWSPFTLLGLLSVYSRKPGLSQRYSLSALSDVCSSLIYSWEERLSKFDQFQRRPKTILSSLLSTLKGLCCTTEGFNVNEDSMN